MLGWLKGKPEEVVSFRETEDTCVHGETAACLRCTFEELSTNPGKYYTPLLIEDIEHIVLAMPAEVSVFLRREPRLVLAGGFIRSVIAGEPIADIDLFFSSGPGNKDVCRIMFARSSNGPIKESEHCFFTDPVTGNKPPIQLVFRWEFPNPYALLNCFDFTICKAGVWYDTSTSKWVGVCHQDYYPDLAAKRLAYFPGVNRPVGSRNVVSLGRCMKYISRGYRISQEDLAQMFADAVMNLTSAVVITDREKVLDEAKNILKRSNLSSREWDDRSAPLPPMPVASNYTSSTIY